MGSSLVVTGRKFAIFVTLTVAACSPPSGISNDADSTMDADLGMDADADADADQVSDTDVVDMDVVDAEADVSDADEQDADPVELRGICEECEEHEMCEPGFFCVNLTTGGRACVPVCNPEFPECPRAFNCVLDVGSGIDTPVCVPVGGPCCVDEDADEYGIGVGCLGEDCDDEDPDRNPGALEICDGEDDDCDDEIDNPPTDCLSGRCIDTGDDSYSAITGADCVDADCVDGDVTECGLFTCEDGGEAGDRCAEFCNPEELDDELYCVEIAHCDDGLCFLDVENGGECDEDSDCVSAHCDNGFCCDGGTCCGVTEDCPGGGGVVALCDDPATCQGTRGETNCEDFVCETIEGIDDDTACDESVEALDCGLHVPVFCTGDEEQTAPECPDTCTSDDECIDAAHCEVGVCAPDRGPGGGCTRPADCEHDLFCVDGVCCDSDCTGPCESCALPASEGTCTLVPAMGDPDHECAGYSCDDYYGGFDARGRCFHQAEVSDALAACSGLGECVGPETLCPLQPTGAVAIDCDDLCQAPTDGTCVEIIAGTCDDLDDPEDTASCGTGACEVVVQRCTLGAPTECTPRMPTAESCNGIDDDCDGDPDDGLATVLCPPGANVRTTACEAGSCRIITCEPLWDDCDLDVPTGCETDLTTLTDCGECASVCDLDHATPTCGLGTCRIDECDDGWGDCDDDDANGCETTLTTLDDCGVCGEVCDLDHASASCGDGTCTIVECDDLWGDCDGLDFNGCERSLATTSDCGDCDRGCDLAHAGETCAEGTCVLVECDDLWASCDDDDTNGCETSLQTNSDCGDCDVACGLDHAAESCPGGVCTLGACDDLWGNCDADDSDG